ncbi:MAG: nucleotide-binding protein [Clostridia bacterium]|nr:nucleotide-binding protein [Clostridia bacterium]
MCKIEMGKIIYTNIHDKISFARVFHNQIYFFGEGGLRLFSGRKENRIVIAHRDDQRCIDACIDSDQLFYFYEKAIDIVSLNCTVTHDIDLCNAEAVCVYDNCLYYIKEGYFIKCNGFGVEFSIPIKNSVKARVIKILNDGYALIGDTKGMLWLIDTKTRKIRRFKIHQDAIQDIIIENEKIITVSRDKKVKCCSAQLKEMLIKQVLVSQEFEHFINTICKNNEGYYLGLSNGTILCIDSFLKLISTWHPHTDAVRYIQDVAENKWMSASDDGTVCFFSRKGGKTNAEKRYGQGIDKIQCSCYLDKNVFFGFKTGHIKYLNSADLTIKDLCKINNTRSLCAINSDILIGGAENGSLYEIQISTGMTRVIFKSKGTSYSMKYNAESRRFFVGRRNGFIDCFKVQFDSNSCIRLQKLRSVKMHESIVGDIADEGNNIFTCSDDQSIKMADYDLNLIDTIMATSHNTAINNLIVCERYIIASSDNGYVYRILRDNLEEKDAFSTYNIPVRALLYSSSDELLYVGDRNGHVYAWDFNGFTMSLYKGTSRVVNIYNIDGQRLIVFEDSIVKLDTEVENMRNREKVFIIHGHNNELKREVQLLLERLGIEGIILHEKPDRGRTIIDKLIEEAEPAVYAIAILTPDDIAESAYRARQNVYLETGYFLGKLGKSRVLLLKLGNIEIPSDLQGVLYTEVDDVVKGYWKAKVAKELVDAGFNVDIAALLKSI